MRSLIPLLLLSACADPIEDDWSFSCFLEVEGRTFEPNFDLDVGKSSKRDGRTVWDVVALDNDDGLPWEGEAVGAGTDAYDLALWAEEGEATFHLEAELVYLDHVSMEGPGSYWVETADDASLVYAGECQLSLPK